MLVNTLTVRQEGKEVLILTDGALLARMPWGAADAFAKALTAKARAAEEYQKSEQIAHDSAIMLRAGAPFTLSNRLDIIKTAIKEAFWNRDIRRYMPINRIPGIESEEAVGTPSIIQHPVKQ